MNPQAVRSFVADRLEKYLDELRGLVEHESPSGDKARLDALAGVIAGRWQGLGGEVDRLANATGDHLVGRFFGSIREKPALVVGHFDTVWPVGTLARLPFRREGGKLYGPGVYDMKASLILVAAVLEAFAALGVKLLSRGRIWWSVATLALFFYPGLRGGMDLGQNPTISLCIVVWGWVLASRGYNVAGGMVWGLFAFKPVWAAAFFLVPFLMGRWRFCLAMVGTGAALGLLTLPLVGIQSWFDWLKVGQDASELYKVNDNWIHLSRDLQGIPRRMLLDFEAPQQKRESPLANTLAWGLWGAVFGATVIVYLLRANRKQPTGVGAGFLFLGAHLTCFHFMYYDSLISAAALAVLFADPRPFFRTKTFALEPAVEEPRLPAGRGLPSPPLVRKPLGARMIGYVNSFPLTVVALLFVVENSLAGLEVEATFGVRQITYFTATGASAKSPVIRGDTSLRYPLDTFLLMALWAWCGWRLLRDRGGPEA